MQIKRQLAQFIILLFTFINHLKADISFQQPTLSSYTVGATNVITIPITSFTISNTNTDQFCITVTFAALSFSFSTSPVLTFIDEVLKLKNIFYNEKQTYPFTQQSINKLASNKYVFCFTGIPSTTLGPDTLTITSLINPSFSGQYKIQIYTSNSSGDAYSVSNPHDYFGAVTSSNYSITQMTSMTNFKIISSSGKVYSDTLTLRINSVLDIPSNSKIYLSFPINWESFGCPIIDPKAGALSCQLASNINPSCTSSVSGASSVITMIVTADLVKNTSYDIILNGLKAPPSQDTYTYDFTLSVKNSSDTGIMYDSIKTQILPLTVSNSLGVSSTQFSNNVQVNSIPNSETLDISITLTTPVNKQNYSLELDLPFNLATAASSNVVITGSGICSTSILSSSYTITALSTLSYRIKFASDSIFLAYDNTLTTYVCKISIPKVQVGPYVNYSGIVKARTFKLSAKVDEGQQTFNGFKIISDPIVSQSLTTLTTAVGAVGSYTFSFDIGDPLSKNAFIIITYKETIISLASSTCSLTCSRGCSTTPVPVCQINKTAKIITLSSIFATDFTSVSTLNTMTMSVTINSVSNPYSAVTPSQSDNFIITTYYDLTLTDNLLVQNTQLGVTIANQFSGYTGINISDVKLTTTNSIVRQNIGTMTILFSFPNFEIMANSIYTITFSSGSFLMGTSSATLQAYWSNDSTQTFTLKTWDNTNRIIVIQSSLAKQNSLGIVLKGDILNPPQTSVSYYATLKITDGNRQINLTTNIFNSQFPFKSNLIASSTSSTGSYTVTTVGSATLTITRGSAQNANPATSYSITITNPSSITILQGFKVYITLPTFQGIPLAVTSCSSGTTAVSGCTQDPLDNTKQYVVIQTLSSTGAINFNMNIQNYISKQPVQFQALVTESNSSNQIYLSQNTQTNTLTSDLDFTSIPDQWVSDVEVTWTITLKSTTPSHDIPNNAQIIIDFPTEFTKLSNAVITCQCTGQAINSRQITLTTSVKNMNVIQISKIYNPGPYVAKSDQLMIYIKDSLGFDISQSLVLPARTDMRYIFNCDTTCRTCDPVNKSFCLTCYDDRSIQANKCVVSCDPGYYSSPSTKTCVACKNNCSTCTSDNVCLTCQTNYYFVPATNQCVQSCSLLESYYQSSNQCLQCDPKCLTCTASQVCQSCRTGYYQVTGQNKCVDVAGCNSLGLFIKQSSCVECESPCATCQTAYNTCLSCLDTQTYKYLQGTSCQSQCNVGYYSDGGNKCQQCDSLCISCTGQPRNCSTCIPTAGFYDNKCYSTCPDNVPLNINGKCTACADNCSICSSLDVCTTCKGSYLLHKNGCVTACPINYETDTTGTKCVLQNVTDILTRNLSENKFVPFPYLIALFLWIAIVLCSRNRAPETFLSGCVVGIGSVIEFATWITFFILQTINDSINTQQNKLFLAALIIHFLFNIVNLILYFIYIRRDQHFVYWVSQFQNKLCHGFVRFFSLIFTHKFENFMYSRFFGFTFFSAKLSSVNSFLQYNIMSGFSIFFVNVPMIVAASATCYYDDIFQQMFIEGLEVIIINVIIIGFMVANIKKPSNFFLQKTADGLNPLTLNMMNSNLDPIPVQSRLMGSYTRTNFGGAESDRGEFKFSNRVSVIGDLEKPLTFGYKLNSQLYQQSIVNGINPNNMNLSYINTQNGKHEITANDYSIDFMNQNGTNKNFYKNNDQSALGSIYGNNNTEQYVMNPNSIHSTQELGEQFSKGKRIYETKQIAKLNTNRPQPIEEQLEDDDDFGHENLHSKLQMTGEDMNMRRVDLMHQSSNVSNNHFQTMRSARSLGGGRIPTNSGFQGYNNYQNQSNMKQPQNSSRPPSYIMDNQKTEKKQPTRQNNGTSKVMTPTRQNTYMQSQNQLSTNNNLQGSSPNMYNQQKNQQVYTQQSAKLTPKRSVSIGVNEQDLLESGIYPSNYQRSGVYDKKIGNRSTKEQSYMSPMRTLQNTKEMNFQNNISARSRSRSASPQRPNEKDQENYYKINNMRSKSRDRLDFYDDDHPEFLEGNIDRLRNGQYQTKNINNQNKFKGGVISPENSPDKNDDQTFDDHSRLNSKIGTNLDELDLLREQSYINRKTNQTIEKVGSEETDNEDGQTPLNKQVKLNSQLFYLSNPMQRPVETPQENNRKMNKDNLNETQQQQLTQQPSPIRKFSAENKQQEQMTEDSSRVQQIQTKIENLDINEYDPYGLNAAAAQKAKKMKFPSNQSSQPILDRRNMLKKQFESDDDRQSGVQDIDSERLDDSSSDNPPVINQHKMIAPPIIPGETIHSNSSPPANQKGKGVINELVVSASSKQLQGSQQNIKTSMRASMADQDNKNFSKPPLNPRLNTSGNKQSESEDDSDEDENIINNINKKRSLDAHRTSAYELDQNNEEQELKTKQLMIKQNESQSGYIDSDNQIDQAGKMALEQIRVVTPMTTMINPRELQKMEIANKNQNTSNQPLRESQQSNQKIDTQQDDPNIIQKSKELDTEFLRQRQKLSQIVNADQLNEEIQRKPNALNQSKENIRQSNQYKPNIQQIISHESSNMVSPQNGELNNKLSKGNSIRNSLQHPLYNIQDNPANQKSINRHNESMKQYTDISATKTENLEFQPVNLDDFSHGGLYSHQQSMNMIGNQQQPNNNIPQILRDNSSISAIGNNNSYNPQAFNLGNPSTGDLNNNYFGLSAKEYEEYNLNKTNISKPSPTHSRIANQYFNQNSISQNEKKRRDVDDIYDSQESIKTASEAQMDFNEISPSDFNVLNQRYEEDLVVEEDEQKSKILQKAISQAPSYYDATNEQDDKLITGNLNNLRKMQTNDSSLPQHVRQSRKSEILLPQTNNQQIYQKVLHAHSNTNSIASINQQHHNFIPQQHPVIITSHNNRNPSEAGSKHFNDNIRHLSDSRSVSYNGNIGVASENHTPQYYNLQNNPNLHYNLNQQPHQQYNYNNSKINHSVPTQQNVISRGNDDSYIDNTQDDHDNSGFGINNNYQILNKNNLGGQSTSYIPQDSGARSNTQKTPQKQDPLDKLKNLEKIYLQRIENSITNSKSNNKLNQKSQRKYSSNSNSKVKNQGNTPNRQAKDTNDALFLDDKNDYQDINF